MAEFKDCILCLPFTIGGYLPKQNRLTASNIAQDCIKPAPMVCFDVDHKMIRVVKIETDHDGVLTCTVACEAQVESFTSRCVAVYAQTSQSLGVLLLLDSPSTPPRYFLVCTCADNIEILISKNEESLEKNATGLIGWNKLNETFANPAKDLLAKAAAFKQSAEYSEGHQLLAAENRANYWRSSDGYSIIRVDTMTNEKSVKSVVDICSDGKDGRVIGICGGVKAVVLLEGKVRIVDSGWSCGEEVRDDDLKDQIDDECSKLEAIQNACRDEVKEEPKEFLKEEASRDIEVENNQDSILDASVISKANQEEPEIVTVEMRENEPSVKAENEKNSNSQNHEEDGQNSADQEKRNTQSEPTSKIETLESKEIKEDEPNQIDQTNPIVETLADQDPVIDDKPHTVPSEAESNLFKSPSLSLLNPNTDILNTTLHSLPSPAKLHSTEQTEDDPHSSHQSSIEKSVKNDKQLNDTNSWLLSDDSSMINTKTVDQCDNDDNIDKSGNWQKRSKNESNDGKDMDGADDHGHSRNDDWRDNRGGRGYGRDDYRGRGGSGGGRGGSGGGRGRGAPTPIVRGRVIDRDDSRSEEKRRKASGSDQEHKTTDTSQRANNDRPEPDQSETNPQPRVTDDDDNWDTLEVAVVDAAQLEVNAPMITTRSEVQGRSTSQYRGRDNYENTRGRDNYGYSRGRGGNYRGNQDRSRSTNRFGDRDQAWRDTNRSRTPYREGRSSYRPNQERTQNSNFDDQWDTRDKSPVFGQDTEKKDDFWNDYKNNDYRSGNQDGDNSRGRPWGGRGRGWGRDRESREDWGREERGRGYRGGRGYDRREDRGGRWGGRGGRDGRDEHRGHTDNYRGDRGRYRGEHRGGFNNRDREGYRGEPRGGFNDSYRGRNRDEWDSRQNGRGQYRGRNPNRSGAGTSEWGGFDSKGSNHNDEKGSESQEVAGTQSIFPGRPYRREARDEFRGGHNHRDRSQSAIRADPYNDDRSNTPDRFNRRSTSVIRSRTPARGGERSRTPGFSSKAVADMDRKYGFVESNPTVYNADLSGLQRNPPPGFQGETNPIENPRSDFNSYGNGYRQGERGGYSRGGYSRGSRGGFHQQRDDHRPDFKAKDWFNDDARETGRGVERGSERGERGRPAHNFESKNHHWDNKQREEVPQVEKKEEPFNYGHASRNTFRGGERQQNEMEMNQRNKNSDRDSDYYGRGRPRNEVGNSKFDQHDSTNRDRRDTNNQDTVESYGRSKNQREEPDHSKNRIDQNQKSATEGLGSNFSEFELTGWEENDKSSRPNRSYRDNNYQQQDNYTKQPQEQEALRSNRLKTPFDESVSKSPKHEKQNLNDTKGNFNYMPTEEKRETKTNFDSYNRSWGSQKDDKDQRRKLLGGDSQDRHVKKEFKPSEFFDEAPSKQSKTHGKAMGYLPTGPPAEPQDGEISMVGNLTFGEDEPVGNSIRENLEDRLGSRLQSGPHNSKFDRSPPPTNRQNPSPFSKTTQARRGRGRMNG